MPTLCRLVVLVLALAVALPAGALAQTPTVPPNEGGELSDDPPVDLDGGDGGSSTGGGGDGGSSSGGAGGGSSESGSRDERASAAELPNTGADPRLLFLAGAALVLIGVGLRLRSADADLY